MYLCVSVVSEKYIISAEKTVHLYEMQGSHGNAVRNRIMISPCSRDEHVLTYSAQIRFVCVLDENRTVWVEQQICKLSLGYCDGSPRCIGFVLRVSHLYLISSRIDYDVSGIKFE